MGNHVVTIGGRVTVDTSGDMRRTLINVLRSKPAKVTVDLSKVTYIDASGLATLVEAVRVARKQNTRFTLRGIQGQTRYFLEITRLDRLFEIDGGEAGA